MTQSSSDQRRPFLSAPSPQRYFAASTIEDARQRIERAIARSEGPAILVGGAGTGKSLLLAVLAEQFASRMAACGEPSRAVVTLAGAQLCTRRALLQMILFELGLPYRDMDEGELRLAILSHLKGAKTPAGAKASPDASRSPFGPELTAEGRLSARRLLLLVDEADTLPIRLLEELRVLTNVAAEGLPLVSLVLAGGPTLEERFADPQLDMFAQRLAARCYLAPFGREETLQYVRSQVAAGGVKPETIFTADALEAIHAATGGVPRLVNQLGDQLMWMAEETNCAPLDAMLVQQAWSDLQQLPAPWNTADHSVTRSASDGVIEYGDLDANVGQPFIGHSFQSDQPDDDSPASIPIATARMNRAVLDVEFDVTMDATEQLLESFDQFEEFDSETQDEEPADESTTAASPNEPTAAANPFDEPFADEEIVLDPYAAFESELFRMAPQVRNRLDRAFAGELHRCVQRAVAVAGVYDSGAVDKTVAGVCDPGDPKKPPASQRPATIAVAGVSDPGRFDLALELNELAPVRLHQVAESTALTRPASGELLVIEDEDALAAAIVPGRQFRRLFSALESNTRSLMG